MSDNGDSTLDSVLPDGARDHPAITTLREKYHIPVLLLVFVYMLAVRLQTYGRFVTDNGVYFSGNDPWYHYRAVKYTIANWPFTMPFDPWTGYPDGADPGQFGTLFDQILATVALIVGLGNPSDQTVRIVMVVAPPVFGALCAIPVYYIGRHLHSRAVGLLGAVALALTPGVFLSRSLVGVADHNIAEPLFMGIAVFALLVAFTRASRDVIVVELIHDRDKDELLNAFGPSIAAGIAMALYLFVWPPGILLVGIATIFYTAYAVIGSWTNRPTEPVLLVGVVSNLVLTVLLLVNINSFQMATASISPLQIGLTLASAGWVAGLIALSRGLDNRDLPTYAFTGITLGVATVGTGLLAVATPDVFQFIWTNVLRVVGFGQHANTLTIGEGQPFVRQAGFFPTVFYSYGMLFFTAVLGLGILVGRTYLRFRNSEDASNTLFIVIWALVITFAAFTQVRFNYYLAPVVAILAAYAVVSILHWAKIPETLPHLETYQYVSLILIVAIVFVPVLVYPMGTSTAVRAQNHGVGEYQAWDEPLDWMNDNTPEYESIDYYGTYDSPKDGSFDYEDDVYGVMSWWDYGHYTTATAERAPVANPFQQNAPEAARFLLAENESEAQGVLDEMGADNVRYVVVDWKMVSPNSKFSAPVVWHPDLEQSDMYDAVYMQNSDGSMSGAMTTMKQRYYESMMVRLYHYHGSSASTGNLVVDYENGTATTTAGDPVNIKVAPSSNSSLDAGSNSDMIKRFNSSQEAAQFVQQDNSAHYGGVGLHPREHVPALEHYRLVKTSETNALAADSYNQYLQQYTQFGDVQYGDFIRNAGWVKVFEHVPGATVQGSGAPANSTVLAQAEMEDATEGSTFLYRQFVRTDANGEFEMTVPYSTTGYDEYGPETGHTNTSVRATGAYEFVSVQQQLTVDDDGNQTIETRQWYTTADVPEGAVNGATDETITVTLEEYEQESPGNESSE